MATETQEAESEEYESRVGASYALSRLLQDTTARISLVLIAIISAMALFAFVDAELLDYRLAETYLYHPLQNNAGTRPLLPPAGLSNQFGDGVLAHPLGTDTRGRDIAIRLLYGSRIAIQIALVSTTIGVVVGTTVGAVSGYYGGWVDDALMRFVEVLYSIPFLVLVIAFMAAFGRELIYAMIGVSIISIPIFARLIRSEVLSIREETYVEAAQAAGVKDRNILLRHIIPNSFAPVVVQTTLQMGTNILIVAGLSFLGFGAQPPTPSWGQMLSIARNYMLPAPWFSVWPGLAILTTVMAFNILGDGLRDTLDPRLEN
ncbi:MULTISPECIES: ABC transporter permease [Halorubrum]|uniref:ABC transporter permease n=1 Tax=Halorubrum ezzemoulense TaxID=337243 RepID=A0A256JJL3_HALEZ|nr:MULTISPECIES: ABC transporter permease [Halorubrum]MDB2282707.1 ABC transporter permease [Halorubrum ezzemoulense]OYR68950.1 ABC transporter permease [Halorubrum ezzemoulense]TKX37679.1 ABC transporter permease [Halorubrum sp. CGM5_25_10-8B]